MCLTAAASAPPADLASERGRGATAYAGRDSISQDEIRSPETRFDLPSRDSVSRNKSQRAHHGAGAPPHHISSPHPLITSPHHIPLTTSPHLIPSPHPPTSSPHHIPSPHPLTSSPHLIPSPHPLTPFSHLIPSPHPPHLIPSPHPLTSSPSCVLSLHAFLTRRGAVSPSDM